MTSKKTNTNQAPLSETAPEELTPDFQMEQEIICSPEFSCIDPEEQE